MTSSQQLSRGSSLLELYVLAQWASLPSIEPDQRRRQLAQQFTAIGSPARLMHIARSIGSFDPELLPQAEWESIIGPLRTDFQRKLASPYSFQPKGFSRWGIIWLRTCYDEGTNEAHQRLLNELNEEMALEVEQNILDDAALYDYGDDWRHIFEVIPERLFLEGPKEEPSGTDWRYMIEQKELIRAEQRNPHINAATDTNALRQATSKLHCEVIVNYLFVADKVALDTGKALLVFFDDCGRTVRHSRIRPEHGESLAGGWYELILDEMTEFTEADIGPDYLPGGSCGPPYAT